MDEKIKYIKCIQKDGTANWYNADDGHGIAEPEDATTDNVKVLYPMIIE